MGMEEEEGGGADAWQEGSSFARVQSTTTTTTATIPRAHRHPSQTRARLTVSFGRIVSRQLLSQCCIVSMLLLLSTLLLGKAEPCFPMPQIIEAQRPQARSNNCKLHLLLLTSDQTEKEKQRKSSRGTEMYVHIS